MTDLPRLFLITPPLATAEPFAAALGSALDAAEVACVLIRTATRDIHAARDVIRRLAPLIQRRGAAALVEDRQLAVRLDVDGVHLSNCAEELGDALAALKPDRIVGAGGLASRHAAMTAGEAGVDYVMFGGPGDPKSRPIEDVEWWAPIFTVPCVGYAADLDELRAIAAAGADFVAVGEALWNCPEPIERTMQVVARGLAQPPGVVP